uniref:PDZ domain-containing protein n=1 Tax=Noctiluca scintillans TaxID=2966 RepID=A0A7S1A3L0_NOCSC
MGSHPCCCSANDESDLYSADLYQLSEYDSAKGVEKWSVDKRTVEAESKCVSVKFLLFDGTLRDVSFSQRPLGIKFTNAAPVTVTDVEPGSHASALHVEVDSVLVAIDHEDVTTFNADAVRILLKGRSKALPLV